MNLIIDLTASEEAEISAAAKQNGMEPAASVKKLVKEHLPTVLPDLSTQELFAHPSGLICPERAAPEGTRAEEDAHLTDAEREENDRVYGEIEKNGIPRVQI